MQCQVNAFHIHYPTVTSTEHSRCGQRWQLLARYMAKEHNLYKWQQNIGISELLWDPPANIIKYPTTNIGHIPKQHESICKYSCNTTGSQWALSQYSSFYLCSLIYVSALAPLSPASCHKKCSKIGLYKMLGHSTYATATSISCSQRRWCHGCHIDTPAVMSYPVGTGKQLQAPYWNTHDVPEIRRKQKIERHMCVFQGQYRAMRAQGHPQRQQNKHITKGRSKKHTSNPKITQK